VEHVLCSRSDWYRYSQVISQHLTPASHGASTTVGLITTNRLLVLHQPNHTHTLHSYTTITITTSRTTIFNTSIPPNKLTTMPETYGEYEQEGGRRGGVSGQGTGSGNK